MFIWRHHDALFTFINKLDISQDISWQTQKVCDLNHMSHCVHKALFFVELREGNVFGRLSLFTERSPTWPLPMVYWISPYREWAGPTCPPPQNMERHCTGTVLGSWGPPPVLTSGCYWSTNGWQRGDIYILSSCWIRSKRPKVSSPMFRSELFKG